MMMMMMRIRDANRGSRVRPRVSLSSCYRPSLNFRCRLHHNSIGMVATRSVIAQHRLLMKRLAERVQQNLCALSLCLQVEKREIESLLHRLGIATVQTDRERTKKVSQVMALTPRLVSQPILRRILNFLSWLLRECRNLIVLTVRINEIIVRLAPMAILAPASILTHQYSKRDTTNHVSDFAWWYFTTSMQALGPGFVKLCQWIATRRDLFPPNVCDRMAHLHDKGTPHSWNHTHSSLTRAFGDYRPKGLEIHDVIGCGSAAQVYRAKLVASNVEKNNNNSNNNNSNKIANAGEKDGQEETDLWVAVKVLHPNIKQHVERDLWLLDTVAKLLHSLPIELIRMANLPRITSNFGNVLRRQVDLKLEADNLVDFRKNFYSSSQQEENSLVLFPRPVEGWISDQVMVEELIEDARPIWSFLRDETEKGLAIRKELGSVLLRAFLKMVFLDNFVHADLHPGNCLVVTKKVQSTSSWWRVWDVLFNNDDATMSETTTTKRKIIFLDAGIATSLNPDDQRNLRDLFRAVILNDGYDAGRLMVERAKYERCSQEPGGIEAFARGIERIVSEFHDNRQNQGLSLGAIQIGSLLGRVLDLCRVHGVEIDPAMASIVISTLVLEGLGRSLDPNLNLIDFAVPFVLGRGRV